MSREHMNEAVRRLHPGSFPGRDFVWAVDPATDELAFLSWNLSGTPDMEALDAECASIAVEEKRKKVNRERDRRIGLGFEYDFGGEAGVHTLDNRADSDALNWMGVFNMASLLIAAGNGEQTMSLRDADNQVFSAPANTVATALVAMAQWRKSILEHSWALKDMPGGVPTDYDDDSYWGG